MFENLEKILSRGRKRNWTDRVQSYVRTLCIAGGDTSVVIEGEVGNETATEGERRLMTVWTRKEEDATVLCLEEREGKQFLEKMLSHKDVSDPQHDLV